MYWLPGIALIVFVSYAAYELARLRNVARRDAAAVKPIVWALCLLCLVIAVFMALSPDAGGARVCIFIAIITGLVSGTMGERRSEHGTHPFGV